MVISTPVAFLHLADDFSFHAQHRGGRILLFGSNPPDGNELARLHSALEFLLDLGNGRLSHATTERRFENGAPVFDCGPFKNVIARVRHGPLRCLLRFVAVRLRLFFRLPLFFCLCSTLPLRLLKLARLRHNAVGLMSVLRGQLTMPLQYFFW